jgi:hypothetical protein
MQDHMSHSSQNNINKLKTISARIPLSSATLVASAPTGRTNDVPSSTQKVWYSAGSWSVGEVKFIDGHRDCLLVNTQPLAEGATAFVLSDFSGGHTSLMFRDTTILWGVSGPSVDVLIDGDRDSSRRPTSIRRTTFSLCRWITRHAW